MHPPVSTNYVFDSDMIAHKHFGVQKDRVTLAAWLRYVAGLFRHALGEMSAASFWRSSGVAVLSFPLQYWAGLRPLKDTLIIVVITLGSGLAVLLGEYVFRLVRTPAKLMLEAAENIQALEAEKAARRAFIVTPKTFTPAQDLKMYAGGFDSYTMQQTWTEASLGVEPAKLTIRCHNLTPSPVIIEAVKLLNADTGGVVVQQDGKAQRIDADSSCEIEIRFGSPENPQREPPQWSGQVAVETARREVFSSECFKFGDLQPPKA